MILEPLECRIAPAAVFKYTDVDGDLVTVKLAVGDINQLVAALTFSLPGDVPRQLQLVNLENLESPLQRLTITAKPQNGNGDGFVNVGAITTSGAAYGSFTVDGDLGAILGLPTTIGKISVRSLGTLGTSTQLAGGQNIVEVTGSVGTFEVKRDLAAKVTIDGTLGLLKVGGSILGTGGNSGGVGWVTVDGRIETVVVGGALFGGSTGTSGTVLGDSFGSVTVGTLRGGSGTFSGAVISESGSIDRIVVRGDVVGGSSAAAQQITAVDGMIKSLRIEGSVIGGSGTYAGDPGDFGQIYAGLGFGSVFIKHDITGGKSDFSGSIVAGADLDATGPLDFSASQRIVRLFIGGSVRGDSGDGSGSVWSDGTVSARIAGSIRGGSGDRSGQVDLDDAFTGAVFIGGDIVGGDGADSGRFVGNADDGDLTTTKLTVRGSVIGGLGPNSGFINANQGGFANVIIAGRIGGGTGQESGGVRLDSEGSSIAKIIVVGDVRGGFGPDSGFIATEGAAALTVGGSIAAGSGARSGHIEIDDVGRTLIKGSVFGGANNAGHIHGDDVNGTLTILGHVIGVTGVARIVCKGDASGGGAIPNPVAFTLIKIGGDVRNAEILAGYDFDFATGVLFGFTPDTQLGAVVVGGDWVQSSLVAGVADGGDNRFGNANDAALVPTLPIVDSSDVRSRIASITIAGSIYGIPGGTDSFGFVAQEIGAFRFGKNMLARVAGTIDPVFTVAPTGDVFVREIA